MIYYVLSIEAGINSWNRTIYFVFPYLLELSNLIKYPVLNLGNEIVLSLKKFLLFRIQAWLYFALVDCVWLNSIPLPITIWCGFSVTITIGKSWSGKLMKLHSKLPIQSSGTMLPFTFEKNPCYRSWPHLHMLFYSIICFPFG